ncbi:MAG TPA: hypothetical protein VHK90_02800 [Thermoanaerobaculia bacterium]|nr:hypothetical protein [Thermoanaerobaculia bacterium]
MKTIVASLLLLATALSAQTPKREVFPSDYKPHPCAADGTAVCESFSPLRIKSYALAFRGYNIHQEWIDAHWDEMTKAFLPLCTKIGNCFTVRDNDWVYCLDIMRDEFLATCNRFTTPHDRDQCNMFAMTYYVGLGAKTELHRKAQECAPAPDGRTLEAWIEPKLIEPHHEGKVTIYAIDAETRIPVRAKLEIDGDAKLKSTEGPNPTAGYPSIWEAKYKRVPNADGHTNVAPPTVTLTATGYEPLTLTLPMPEVHAMKVEMNPPASKLRRGTNTITVTATDAVTGKPVWGHVFAGTLLLGETNKPIELVWNKGEKRPEIWVTALYGQHHDAVVAPAER